MIKRLKIPIQKEPFLYSALVLAAIIYSAISLVNHYCFRTHALDLGLYTNALYDYAHFSWNDSAVFKEHSENLLADHFDLYLPLFSPLVYLFGTYTLLIVQIASILVGAVGVYRLIEHKFPQSKLKNYAVTYFLLFFGIFSAISFDYHSNVVASMLVPWLFLAIDKRQFLSSFILVVLLLIGKENLALWVVFIALALFVKYFRDKQLRYFLLGILVFSLLYFIVITGYVMPALSNSGKYPHFHYSKLGLNVGEAIKHILNHPLDSFRLLFINHSGIPLFDFIKAETWIFLLLTGLFCLFRPLYLVMLIPIIGQKMFHDNPAMWSVNYQYSIEFAPIFAIGIFEGIGHLHKKKLQKTLAIFAVILSFSCTIRLMDNTIYPVDKNQLRLYKAEHYQATTPKKETSSLLQLIPKTAIVSAQTQFVPHLALRPSVYQFPIIKEAEYILLAPLESAYPLNAEQFAEKIIELKKDPTWEVAKQTQHVLLFKRKAVL